MHSWDESLLRFKTAGPRPEHLILSPTEANGSRTFVWECFPFIHHQPLLVNINMFSFFFFFSFTSGFSPEVPSARRGNSLFHFVELSDRPLRICLPIKRWFLSLAWEVCYQLTETFLSRPLSHTCSTLYKVYGPKYMCHAGNRLVGDSTADAFLLNCGWESARIAVSWTRDKQNWTTNERRPIASRLSGQSLVLNTLNFFHQLPKRR